MKRNNLIDFLIILFVYIGISCFPFSLFNLADWLIKILQIVAQVLILVFIIYFVKNKSKLEYNLGKINWKNTLILLPTLVACFSNYFYILSLNTSVVFKGNNSIILDIILTIFVVINEETIFRLLLISNLENKKKWYLVLMSALVFGLCHITGFLSSFNPSALIQILYTIPLGALLAISYLFSNSILMPLVIHLIFNVFNNVIYSCLSFVDNLKNYFLVNVIVGIVVGSYLLMVFYFANKKNKFN